VDRGFSFSRTSGQRGALKSKDIEGDISKRESYRKTSELPTRVHELCIDIRFHRLGRDAVRQTIRFFITAGLYLLATQRGIKIILHEMHKML
jgi:hypothetical protein